jgi:hypothetical protein
VSHHFAIDAVGRVERAGDEALDAAVEEDPRDVRLGQALGQREANALQVDQRAAERLARAACSVARATARSMAPTAPTAT